MDKPVCEKVARPCRLCRSGLCSACHRPVRLHWDPSNTFVGCAGAFQQEPLDAGRLRRLILLRAQHARDEALRSLSETRGGWAIRIGGWLGHRRVFHSREAALAAMQDHYNNTIRALLEAR